VIYILAKLTQQPPGPKLIIPKGIIHFAKNHKHSWFLNRELQKIQITVKIPSGFAKYHKNIQLN
jgi:hypothetical protein